jgi:hypothetical protein
MATTTPISVKNIDIGLTASITVMTTLAIINDVLDHLNGLTCLYNADYYAEPDRATLPICMFHVKKITETWQNETSQKRVILFEPQGDAQAKDAASPFRQGVMRNIVDNIVAQPKTYSLEIIVPYLPFGRTYHDWQNVLTAVIDSMMEWQQLGSMLLGTITGSIQYTLSMVAKLETLLGNLTSENVRQINKNSLEAMAESNKILIMKMWTGWHYKYAAITGLTFDKNPLEDNMFRATLQLKEMPVLSLTQPKSLETTVQSKQSTLSTLLSSAYNTVSKPLKLITGMTGF